MSLEQRIWIRSGVVEDLDQRQSALLELVLAQIKYYYRDLYQTRPCFQYPLSLSRLMKLCNRSSSAVTLAIRYLANTVPHGSNRLPEVFYDRISSERHKARRPYRIFLRTEEGGL